MTKKRLRELLVYADEERNQLSIECIELRKRLVELRKRLDAETDYGNQLFITLRNGILPALEKAKKEYSRAAEEYARKKRPPAGVC